MPSLATFRPQFQRKEPSTHAAPDAAEDMSLSASVPRCKAFVPGLGPCILSRHGDEIEHTVEVPK